MFHEDRSSVKCGPVTPVVILSSKEQKPQVSRKCQIIKMPSVIQNLDLKKILFSIKNAYDEEGRKQLLTDLQF